jgi:hypothetical protein
MPTIFPTVPGPLGFLIKRTRTVAVASVLLACLPHAAPAAQNQFTEGKQSLSVEFPNGCRPQYGFHPVKLTAVNMGTQPAAWEIWVHNRGVHDRSLNHNGRRERLVVAPNRTVERELLIPLGNTELHSSWGYLQVEVIMPSGETGHWNPLSHSGGRRDLSGVTVPTLLTPKAIALLSDAPDGNDMFHGRMNPAAAVTDWRGYASFALVVLTADDWQAMSAAARTALGDWARMGGHLQFVGSMPADAPATDNPGKPGRGLGAVHAPLVLENNSKETFYGLPGALAAMKSGSPTIEAISSDLSLIAPWVRTKGADLLQDKFTIWPMVLVLIAFFVMITPINLFVLAPSKRRHRLFRTIPVISLSACALLALAVGLGDGVGGRGERLVLIESRPGTDNRQYITQWQASRCGALIGTGFTVPDAAFLAPLRDPGSAVTLSVEGDRLEAGGGWFTSRATQSHFLQAARAGRGRIEWSGKDATVPTAVSTFDFPLRDVYVLQEDGTWWYAPTMRQGETTALHAMDAKEMHTKLGTMFENMPQRADMQEMARRPGHYIAFTDTPPAIESLRSVRWKDTGIVAGAMAAH